MSEPIGNGTGVTNSLQQYDAIAIFNSRGEVVVRVDQDGQTIFGPGFSTKERAAWEFWAAIGHAWTETDAAKDIKIAKLEAALRDRGVDFVK